MIKQLFLHVFCTPQHRKQRGKSEESSVESSSAFFHTGVRGLCYSTTHDAVRSPDRQSHAFASACTSVCVVMHAAQGVASQVAKRSSSAREAQIFVELVRLRKSHSPSELSCVLLSVSREPSPLCALQVSRDPCRTGCRSARTQRKLDHYGSSRLLERVRLHVSRLPHPCFRACS